MRAKLLHTRILMLLLLALGWVRAYSANELVVLTCPANEVVIAPTGQCNASVVDIDPRYDIPDSEISVLEYELTGATTKEGLDDASGTSFGIGVTTCTYSIEDVNGNTDQCTFTVTVLDEENPVITCGETTVIPNIPGECRGRILTDITPMNSDNCNVSNLVFSISGATSGSGFFIQGFPFNAGLSVVTYTATDNSGNTSTCNLEVIVADQEAPSISCPIDTVIQIQIGNTEGIVNDINPIALNDNCAVDTVFHNFSGAMSGSGDFFASGSTFPLGATTVEYMVVDTAGNPNSCSFIVTLEEANINELIDCPADVIAPNDAGQCETNVNTIAPQFLTDPSNISLITYQQFGSMEGSGVGDASGIYPVGITTVRYIAISTTGIMDTCLFTVTVEDLQMPVWSNCPDTIRQGMTPGICGSNVNFQNPVPSDNCGISNLMTSHSSGDLFIDEFTTVTYTAYDPSGNTTECNFVIQLIDVESPTIANCPTSADVSYNPLPDCKAEVVWDSPTAIDNCSGVTLNTTLTSGSIVDVAQELTVLYVAVDGNGNDVTCTFDIQAPDVNPPTPTNCPNNVALSANPGTCVLPYSWTEPSAFDDCSSFTVSSTHTPGMEFPVGTTTVVYTFTDEWQNSSNCSFEILIQDSDLPTIACPQDVEILLDGTVIADPSSILTDIETTNDCEGIKLTFDNPQASDLCAGLIATNQANGIASGLTFPEGNNNVQFTAVDLNSNTADCFFNIQVSPIAAPTANVIGGFVKCEGDDVLFITNEVEGASYFWQGPGSWSATGLNPTRPNIQTNQTGLYSLTISTASGCTSTDLFSVFVNQSPDISTTDLLNICSDGTSDLFLNVTQDPNGADVDTWLWTGPCDFESTIPNPTLESISLDCSGAYTVTGTALNGCTDQAQMLVEVVNLESPNLQSDCGETICLGESCTLFGTDFIPIPEQYHWAAFPANNAGLPSNTDNNELTITPQKEGTYVFSYWVTTEGCISDTASIIINVVGSPDVTDDTFNVLYETKIENFNVVFNDSFNINANFTIQNLNQTSNGVVENNEDGTFDYTPDPGYLGTDQFIYEICYDCDGETCETGIVSLFVKIFDFECEVPTLITPNNDGLNDELFINCIESNEYPNNELRIFNQWGDEVFFSTPYLNDWTATFEGNDLTDGTYFYLFKRSPEEEALRGYVTVFR